MNLKIIAAAIMLALAPACAAQVHYEVPEPVTEIDAYTTDPVVVYYWGYPYVIFDGRCWPYFDFFYFYYGPTFVPPRPFHGGRIPRPVRPFPGPFPRGAPVVPQRTFPPHFPRPAPAMPHHGGERRGR